MGPQGEVGQQGLMGLLGLTGPVGPQGLVGQELVSLSNLPAGEYLVLARLNSFNAFRTGAGATMGCFVTAQGTLYQVPTGDATLDAEGRFGPSSMYLSEVITVNATGRIAVTCGTNLFVGEAGVPIAGITLAAFPLS